MFLAKASALYLATVFATSAEGKWDFRPAKFGDDSVVPRVLAVTPTSVMIAKTEAKNEVVVYPFHFRLACGSYNLLELADADRYGRSDLKVGDLACLRILKLDPNVEYCVSINIRQRPDGKVPPSRNYRLGDWQPYHEKVEAIRAFNNDKIPLPLHLGFKGRQHMFPAFDPRIERKDRIKPWPSQHPFTYIEYALFLR